MPAMFGYTQCTVSMRMHQCAQAMPEQERLAYEKKAADARVEWEREVSAYRQRKGYPTQGLLPDTLLHRSHGQPPPPHAMAVPHSHPVLDVADPRAQPLLSPGLQATTAAMPPQMMGALSATMPMTPGDHQATIALMRHPPHPHMAQHAGAMDPSATPGAPPTHE